MTTNYFDTDRMAEIILALKIFGDDRVINFLLDRLIRNESDHLPLLHKSKGVSKFEEHYRVSIAGLSRAQTRRIRIKELKGKIIIEHGLPERQAIEMCFKSNSKNEIKTVLEEIKNNLVCITVDEDKGLKRGEQRRKGPSGFYWEEAYQKCKIIVIENPPPDSFQISITDWKLSKRQAMALVNKKLGKHLDDGNTMFSNIDAVGVQWGITRKNKHFNNDTYMILNDHNKKQLHYFYIESGKIKTPNAIFMPRQDKPDHSIIYIKLTADNFRENYSGFPFGDYKVDTISYQTEDVKYV